jgi:hypothetical protein
MKTKNFQWFLTILVVLAFSFTAPAAKVQASPAVATGTDPIHILFAKDATSAEVSGTLTANSKVQYILRAFSGQLMDVSLSAAEGGTLSVTTLAGTVLTSLSGTGSSTSFRGYLPRTGNYLLTISAGSKAISYSMNVSIPQRISFKWGTTSDTLTGSLKAHESHGYILRAGTGQLMEINITPDVAANSPQIIVYGVDGTVLQSGMGEAKSFRGLLPLSQDYFVTVRAGEKDVAFSMNVIIPRRVTFATGTTSATFSGWLPAGQSQYYVLNAQKDQTLKVEATPGASLQLAIYGADGTTFNSGAIVGGVFSGKLPKTQDYIIVVKTGLTGVSYKLAVSVK